SLAVSRISGARNHLLLALAGRPWALNGASAAWSSFAAAAFVLCARRLGCRDALLAGLAFAMTPIFFHHQRHLKRLCLGDRIGARELVLCFGTAANPGGPFAWACGGMPHYLGRNVLSTRSHFMGRNGRARAVACPAQIWPNESGRG